ncbi:hypothetical protein HYU23_00845 [Candidatus Woesearchaeota archaeon]|nr:hypothetical protein [Candidatus Woesearchaeota archaeon]
MRKRGQAAAFIIIGIIIIMVVISVISIRKGILTDLFEGIATERRAVPQQIRPLQDFLDSCVTSITKEAVSIAALQGGRIILEDDELPITQFTPLGRSLEIIPNSDLKTSVWFRERGNSLTELNVPTKTSIENEIGNYVAGNFGSCIFNLTSFEDQGYIISASGTPKANVELGEGKLSAVINFPLNVKIADTNFTLSQHRADIDSNLGKLYNMAKQILEKENKAYFLENKTIDTLVAYDPEIPFTGTDLSCSEKIWLKSDVEIKLKNILFENVAAMRIKGTNYELNNENFKYLEFDALEDKDDSININLMYIPNWPTLIEINPSDGNILRNEQISKKSGGTVATIMSTFFCLRHHRFVYDIKYPVLITLRDNAGLSFQFATQVVIDNNEPRQNRREILDLPDVESPICRYPQKEVTIFTGTLNSRGDLVPLNNVSLMFKCFPATCPLGSSSLNPDGEPVLTTFVPLCFNGVIEGSREGYKQIQKIFYSSNQVDTPPVAVVQLEPLYTKKVNLFVIDKSTGKVREPYSSEQISFQFAHRNVNYQINYIHPGEENTIKLLAGNYVIDSYVLRNSSTYKITIPKEQIETCVDTRDFSLLGFFKTKQVCKTTETEKLDFDTVLVGGATSVEHIFNREDLANEEPLNLYVLESEMPSNLDDLQRLQIELDTNKDHPLYREATIE